MKFTMAIEKKTKVTVGASEGHNTRQHPTMSQLQETAWFTPKGRHQVLPWRQEVLDAGKALAKLKDAVVAIEIIVQVGNQTDWRDLPTSDHPHGKPKPGSAAKLKALMAGAKLAAIREFGESNIVGIDLHTDESSPHVHIVVTPVHEGKLQAKQWLDGAKKCAQLRARIHEVVSHHIECSYEKGAPGGAPHEPSKAAGGPKGPQPRPGLLKRAVGAFDAFEEARQLKAKLEEMQLQMQTMFSRVKRFQREAAKLQDKSKKEQAQAASAERRASKLQKRVNELELQVDQLRPKVADLASAPAPSRKVELAS